MKPRSHKPEITSPHSSSEGRLVLVATPLGNMGDLSPRALETLRSADLVLAEDTRSFGRLKSHFGFSTESESFFEHNERGKTKRILEHLEGGANISLVSDAGTPSISDPGFHLVRSARAAGIKVSTVPGPCAAVAALSISGFETDRFVFEGFLPRRPGRMRVRLEEILAREMASIIYESPHRIVKTVGVIKDLEESREMFLARELTKIYEECLSLTASEMFAELTARSSIKGEIVLVVRGRKDKAEDTEEEDASLA